MRLARRLGKGTKTCIDVLLGSVINLCFPEVLQINGAIRWTIREGIKALLENVSIPDGQIVTVLKHFWKMCP